MTPEFRKMMEEIDDTYDIYIKDGDKEWLLDDAKIDHLKKKVILTF